MEKGNSRPDYTYLQVNITSPSMAVVKTIPDVPEGFTSLNGYWGVTLEHDAEAIMDRLGKLTAPALEGANLNKK